MLVQNISEDVRSLVKILLSGQNNGLPTESTAGLPLEPGPSKWEDAKIDTDVHRISNQMEAPVILPQQTTFNQDSTAGENPNLPGGEQPGRETDAEVGESEGPEENVDEEFENTERL